MIRDFQIILVCAGATYAAATQKVAQYRQRDGPINHFYGTLFAAPFIAMLYRKYHAWKDTTNKFLGPFERGFREKQAYERK